MSDFDIFTLDQKVCHVLQLFFRIGYHFALSLCVTCRLCVMHDNDSTHRRDKSQSGGLIDKEFWYFPIYLFINKDTYEPMPRNAGAGGHRESV